MASAGIGMMIIIEITITDLGTITIIDIRIVATDRSAFFKSDQVCA